MWTWIQGFQSPSAIVIGGITAYAVLVLAQFLRADASRNLMRLPPTPAAAYRGKVVWILGASQGLGASLATRCASLGARVILTSRSRDKLERVAAACRKVAASPSDVLVLPLDVLTSYEEVSGKVRTAFHAFDGAGVDYMFYNAGASQHARVERASAKVSADLLDLNLVAPLNFARASTPRFLKQGRGRHVVIASMAAVLPSPGQAAYAASKAGLVAYFRSLSTEVSSRGVGVTIVCPGPIAAGPGGQLRTVFGPDGPTVHGHDPRGGDSAAARPDGEGAKTSKTRVSLERATELVTAAAAHGVDEGWIARHPVLALAYVYRFAPGLATRILKAVGPKRARNLHGGKDGYSARGLLSEGKKRATEATPAAPREDGGDDAELPLPGSVGDLAALSSRADFMKRRRALRDVAEAVAAARAAGAFDEPHPAAPHAALAGLATLAEATPSYVDAGPSPLTSPSAAVDRSLLSDFSIARVSTQLSDTSHLGGVDLSLGFGEARVSSHSGGSSRERSPDSCEDAGAPRPRGGEGSSSARAPGDGAPARSASPPTTGDRGSESEAAPPGGTGTSPLSGAGRGNIA